MNNQVILIKVQERINKLASSDYDNIESWQIIEAFNKAQVEWCRRQIAGTNNLKQGDESSKRRIDDLQGLLKSVPVILNEAPLYYESGILPDDYFEYKTTEVWATKGCCKDPRLMMVYEGEDANAVIILRDENKKPSFEWGETFITIGSDKLKVYTGGDFQISSVKFTYYRQPTRIQIKGSTNPETQLISTTEVISEFKDDIVEIIIDEAVKILAGDIESMNVYNISGTAAEKNN